MVVYLGRVLLILRIFNETFAKIGESLLKNLYFCDIL